MLFQNVTDLITVDGNSLLAQLQFQGTREKPLCLDADLFKNISSYSESALLYQIRQELKQDFSRNLWKHILFYVDFWDFFQHKDDGRSALFTQLLNDGFWVEWVDTGEIAQYVPFEKSQSQAKNCIISFIREDLFQPIRRRLDLDICFGDFKCETTQESFCTNLGAVQLSKLYAYRGLYLTEAIRLDGLKELLNENRIIILKEDSIPIHTPVGATRTAVYTADYEITDKDKAELTGKLETEFSNPSTIEPFDGVGLISPRGAALFNKAMDTVGFSKAGIDPATVTPQQLLEHQMAVSFQFRLPFCKGMLHTVDFHGFLRQEGQLPEDCWVEDIFGIQRNLKDADMILNQTLFKLYGLLQLDKVPEKKANFIHHYFQKINAYDHSIYIAKTDRQQRNTGYVRLTSQIINTLPFTQDAFDRLIQQHIQRAQQYKLEDIILRKGELSVIEENSTDMVDQYIQTCYLLALDSYVEELVNSCRKQALNALYQGKIEVEGDMRFLSRDLIYYLYRLGARCGVKKKFSLIPRGSVYLPGEPKQQACAVFRSPHLCPNENVMAVTAEETELYNRYLGHLHRVVFVGTYSQMPDALGGADFDGDMVVVAFQPEVVEACEKICYREDGTGLPLIRIPSCKPPRSTRPVSRYVDALTIENTFNSQIGLISNATMKICAAEAFAETELPFPSQYCAILNGVEIDAAKTGVRPNLNKVIAFSGGGNRFAQNDSDEDSETESETDSIFNDDPRKMLSSESKKAMRYVGTYLRLCKKLKSRDLTKLSVKEDKGKYVIKCGQTQIATFRSDISDKPFVYQLLCGWAQGYLSDPNAEEKLSRKDQAVDQLREELLNIAPKDKQPVFSQSTHNYPRKEILQQLVFPCRIQYTKQQFADVSTVAKAYYTVKKDLDQYQKDRDSLTLQTAHANLIYILRYKYDDVDKTENNQPTIRQLGNSIETKLRLSLNTEAALADVLETNFYSAEDQCCPWLLTQEQKRMKWLRSFLDDQTAEIAGDFGARGYDLMYYALRGLHSQAYVKELREVLAIPEEDSLLNTLYSEAVKSIQQGYSVSDVLNHVLPSICLEQIQTLTGESDPDVLIPLVYHSATAKDNSIFWKMFSPEEIKAYLNKEKANAKRS